MIAASADSTIAGLDREFPLLEQDNSARGSRQGMQPKPAARTSLPEILLVALIVLLAAVFSYKFGR